MAGEAGVEGTEDTRDVKDTREEEGGYDERVDCSEGEGGGRGAGRECGAGVEEHDEVVAGDREVAGGRKGKKKKGKRPGEVVKDAKERAAGSTEQESSTAAMGMVASGQGGQARGRALEIKSEMVEMNRGGAQSAAGCASSMEEGAPSPAAVVGASPAAGGCPPAGAAATEEVECCVCMETRKSHIFIPCGHFCACQQCADAIMAADKPECPMCRHPADKHMRVYG